MKVINDKFNKKLLDESKITDSTPFVKYLEYSILRQDKNIIVGKPKNFFSDARFNGLRNLDLYLFYYCVIKKTSSNVEQAPGVLALKMLNVDMEDLASSQFYSQFRSSFQYMTRFFDLFEFFETKTGLSTEQNREAKHAKTFDLLYKFLLNIRYTNNFMIPDPEFVLWNTLEFCLQDRYNRVIHGDRNQHGEDEEGSITIDAEELFDYEGGSGYSSDGEEITYIMDPCTLTYSELNRVYPIALMKLYSDNDGYLDSHIAQFQEGELAQINTNKFFEYLRDSSSQNLINIQFQNFCSPGVEIQICDAQRAYLEISKSLETTSLKEPTPSRNSNSDLPRNWLDSSKSST